MPSKDRFHEAVKKGLIKDGWTITADPLTIQSGGVDMYIDLAAEKIVAAEKDGRKIAVEIKTFLAPSLIAEFHSALGQFIDYRIALQQEDPERVLYLAVPIDTYETFFSLPFTQRVVSIQQVKLLVYNQEQESVVTWRE